MFEKEYEKFWQEFGKSKIMVLSSSLDGIVSSRAMSVVNIDGRLYFQTGNALRKYSQLKGNPHVALCIDNIQIEGLCSELGRPADNEEFCAAYKECFAGSFSRYSMLEDERLFVVEPSFIERWVYIDDVPYMKIIDIDKKEYISKRCL